MTDVPEPEPLFDDRQAAFIRIITEGGTWRDAQNELTVSSATIAGWLKDDVEFQKHYVRATDVRAEVIFEQMLNIADQGTNDWMAVNDPDNPGYRENGEAIRRTQVRLDTRKWVLGRMKPKVYGDKITQEHTGPGGEALVFQTIIEAKK